MASFTFGSVGDIIAICQIVQSTVSALNDARGSAAEYQALGRSLANLMQVLVKIDHLTQAKKDVVNMASLDQTLRDCLTCLRDFHAKIDKYSRALGARGQKQILKDVYRKIKWINEKEEVSNFHRDVATYLAVLQLLLQLAGFEINAADQAVLHQKMSDTDVMIAKGFSDAYTLLEKIDRTIQLRGEGSVSNAAVGATETLRRLERRATSLAASVEVSKGVSEAYDEAVAKCKAELSAFVRECRMVNRTFTDHGFDLDHGLACGLRDCLVSLDNKGEELNPGCVRRINNIFEAPVMFIDGSTQPTIVSLEKYQYFAAVMTALQSREGMINRLFIYRDELIDVYGFVFYRDGEWLQSLIDGCLYLERPEYSPESAESLKITSKSPVSQQQYEAMALTGSRALYFAASVESNETAIPLLEKAYARAHGDYGAIQDLYVGDVLEDFTGGVTYEVDLSSMPSRDEFWHSTLLNFESCIVFGSRRRVDANSHSSSDESSVQVAVLKKTEIDGFRLVCLRYSRPSYWHWTGAWSDGSQEWTPEWLGKLGHTFGDESTFWMSYKDFVTHFSFASVHRIFDGEWQTCQIWAAFEVPWSQDTLPDVFHFEISGDAPVVIVLSQLDTSYFRGLEGQYDFELDFTIFSADGQRIARAGRRYPTHRSNNISLNLERGSYMVRPHIIARKRDASRTVNNTILATSRTRQDKLLKTAHEYDLAHAKIAGWRTVIERMQEKKRRWAEAQKSVPLVGRGTEKAQNEALPQHEHEPPTLSTDETLGYGDWDAVVALGLRVLSLGSQASIELTRHQDEERVVKSGKDVIPPPGTTMADYESEHDVEGTGNESPPEPVHSSDDN